MLLDKYIQTYFKVEKINSDYIMRDCRYREYQTEDTCVRGRLSRGFNKTILYASIDSRTCFDVSLVQEVAVTFDEMRHIGRDHCLTYRDLNITRDIRAIPLLSVVIR